MIYYKICGHQSHTRRWFQYNDKLLCETVFNALSEEKPDARDVGVELILGIIPNGASYILATPDQMNMISRYCRKSVPGHGDLASDYASLSPIEFKTLGDLEKKVRTYQQKARRGSKAFKRTLEGNPADNSQANKSFFLGNSSNTSRPNFEHQRLLWKAVRSTIQFSKFCMPSMYWLSSTSFVGLCLNTWDFGPIPERRQNPKILDIGWTSVPCMSFRGQYKEETFPSTHVVLQEHLAFSNSGTKRVSFEYGETKNCKLQEAGMLLKEYFKNLPQERILLVVADKELTLNALSNLGLDTSNWQIGINKVLRSERYETHKHENVERNRHDWNGWGQREESPWGDAAHPRARSRSPIRQVSSKLPLRQGRIRSPPREMEHPDSELEEGQECEDDESDNSSEGPAIHVVGVRDLFVALSLDSSSRKNSLHMIARKLGISANPGTICAGNDCHLLLRIWMAMASGSPIDEQRVERWSCAPEDCLPLEPPESDKDAEEVDINDIDPATFQNSRRSFREPGNYVPDGDDSEDEDWY